MATHLRQRALRLAQLASPANDITTASCSDCGQPVSAVNGLYTCTTCGHSGNA